MSRGARLLPFLLLGASFALCASAIPGNSATYDETAYVPAGWTYLSRRDYRLSPEHPPLLKALSALPTLALRPALSAEAESAFAAAADRIDAQWIFGDRFLYRDNRPRPFLHRARLVVALLGVGLGAVVFLWSRALFGYAGAVVSLAFSALDPNLLAHAGLATTDLGTALFFAGALFFAWRTCERLRPGGAVGCALCCAGAFASKFSAVLLFAAIAAGACVRRLPAGAWPIGRGARAIRSFSGRLGAVVALLAFLALVSWGGIWAAYRFRYRATAEAGRALPMGRVVDALAHAKAVRRAIERGAPPEALPVAEIRAEAAERGPGLEGRLVELAAGHRLLPESYLFGLAFAASKAQARSSYLLGELDVIGRPSYFPIAFAVKTPLPAILAVLAGVVLAFIRRGRRGALAFGLLPPLFYFAVAVGSDLNIGHRHLLPIYPPLFVLAGGIGAEVARLRGARRTLGTAAIGASLLWLAAGTIRVHPHLLAYFNEVAGGPRGGHRWLLDSNLDWGQALPALRRWMDESGVDRVNLLYFGTADPAAYGIESTSLPGSHHLEVPGAGAAGRPGEAPRIPGYVAVSATHLHGVYLPEPLRRAYAFLRTKRPVATPGHAIFVYRVDRWGR